MERHDPLGLNSPCEEVQPQSSEDKKERKRRVAPLLSEIALVKDDSLAFLYGGPDQQPGDYQRNLQRAGIIRDAFVRFCAANLHFPNWRQAWAAFFAQYQDEPVDQFSEPAPIYSEPCKAANKPGRPRWKQRFCQMART
jgi:hypothetical protein